MITAVVPAYNVAPFIAEALDSLLSQEPPFHEIIVIDDGSTDGTSEILDRYSDRVRLITQENQGLGGARNTGIMSVKSPYIILFDSDDILLPGLTSRFANEVEKHGDLDLFCFSAESFATQGAELPREPDYVRHAEGIFPTGLAALDDSLRCGPFISNAYLYVFRKEALSGPDGSTLLFEPFLHEDEIFTPQLFRRAGLTAFTRGFFYRRRVRAGSIMTSKPTVANVVGCLRALEVWKLEMPPLHGSWRQQKRLYLAALKYAVDGGVSRQALETECPPRLQGQLEQFLKDMELFALSRKLMLSKLWVRRLHHWHRTFSKLS